VKLEHQVLNGRMTTYEERGYKFHTELVGPRKYQTKAIMPDGATETATGATWEESVARALQCADAWHLLHPPERSSHVKRPQSTFASPIVQFAVVLIICLIAGILLSSCGGPQPNAAPPPQSDSNQRYGGGVAPPVDDNVYTIRGTVGDEVQNMQRQSAGGSGSSSSVNGYGFVRLSGASITVEETVTQTTQLADLGALEPQQVLLIKTTDSKVQALAPGDQVTFKCRAQYETLAAVRNNSQFTVDQVEPLGTWEFDYCRLVEPVLDRAANN
jgi:hypothetical protein